MWRTRHATRAGADKPEWLRRAPLDAADLANLEVQYAMRLRAMLSTDVLIGRVVAALGDDIARRC